VFLYRSILTLIWGSGFGTLLDRNHRFVYEFAPSQIRGLSGREVRNDPKRGSFWGAKVRFLDPFSQWNRPHPRNRTFGVLFEGHLPQNRGHFWTLFWGHLGGLFWGWFWTPLDGLRVIIGGVGFGGPGRPPQECDQKWDPFWDPVFASK